LSEIVTRRLNAGHTRLVSPLCSAQFPQSNPGRKGLTRVRYRALFSGNNEKRLDGPQALSVPAVQAPRGHHDRIQLSERFNPPVRTRSSGESRSNLYYSAEGWVRRSPAGFCLAAALFTTKTASAPWGGPARTRRDFAIVGRTEFDPVRQRSERPPSCRRALVADEFSSMICVGSQPSCSRGTDQFTATRM
jgi:hypothetical protein